MDHNAHHMMMTTPTMDMTTSMHDMMNHTTMGHGGMDHGGMDHGGMDHGGMDHGGMDHGGMDHGSMMPMYFHFGYIQTILFNGWAANTPGQMVGTCIAFFVIALLYEGLKMFRESLLQKQAHKAKNPLSTSDILENGQNSSINITSESNSSYRNHMLALPHLLQTLLHMIQLTVSYILMLVFMTFNLWLCIAVVLGSGAGYFLFGWRRTLVLDSTEHCH